MSKCDGRDLLCGVAFFLLRHLNLNNLVYWFSIWKRKCLLHDWNGSCDFINSYLCLFSTNFRPSRISLWNFEPFFFSLSSNLLITNCCRKIMNLIKTEIQVFCSNYKNFTLVERSFHSSICLRYFDNCVLIVFMFFFILVQSGFVIFLRKNTFQQPSHDSSLFILHFDHSNRN